MQICSRHRALFFILAVKRNHATGGARRDRVRPSRLASRVSRLASRACLSNTSASFFSKAAFNIFFSFYFTKETIEVWRHTFTLAFYLYYSWKWMAVCSEQYYSSCIVFQYDKTWCLVKHRGLHWGKESRIPRFKSQGRRLKRLTIVAKQQRYKLLEFSRYFGQGNVFGQAKEKQRQGQLFKRSLASF